MSSVKGLDTVLSNLKKEGANIEECIFKGIENALKIGQTDAKMNAPAGNNEGDVSKGHLRELIFTQTENNKGKIEGAVYGTAPHHPYVEFGTGPTGNGTYPYTIKGYSLHYKANKWKVKIPFLVSEKDSGIRYIAGQVAQPHMYPAMLLVEKNLISEIKKASRR